MTVFRRAKEFYAGMAIAASPGTHEAAVKALQRHCSKDTRVLDFGCYEGAMIARLRDCGFSDVEGTDLTKHFSTGSFQFTEADLNKDFSSHFTRAPFGALMASEVIEHLDDPRHFLAGCYELLAEDGVIVITTPNIAFFEGRIKFFLGGELWGFGENNYTSQRHISAITRQQFKLILDECGYELREIFSAASFASTIRWIATAIIWLPMRLIFGKSVLGESLIVVGSKKPIKHLAYSSGALWGN